MLMILISCGSPLLPPRMVQHTERLCEQVEGKQCELMGAVTSIAMCPDKKGFFAGTALSNRWTVTSCNDRALAPKRSGI